VRDRTIGHESSRGRSLTLLFPPAAIWRASRSIQYHSAKNYVMEREHGVPIQEPRQSTGPEQSGL
jgi:hypothetical protein